MMEMWCSLPLVAAAGFSSSSSSEESSESDCLSAEIEKKRGRVTDLLSGGSSSRLGLLLLVITGVFIAGLGLGGSGSGLGGLLLVGAVVRVGVGVGCLGSLLSSQHIL
jgi:hypothetical protein